MTNFSNDRSVLVGDYFAKPDKRGSNSATLRYGRVLALLDDGQILVQMAGLDKPSKVQSLESSLFLEPHFIPKRWRLPIIGLSPDA